MRYEPISFGFVASKEHKGFLYVISTRNPLNYKPEIARKGY